MYNSKSEPTYSRREAILGGLAALASGLLYQGCGPKRKKVPVPVPGQPPTPNGQPILDALQANYQVTAGNTLIIPLTGRDDFSPGQNVNGVITPDQPLELRLLPGTTDTRATVTKLTETIANPQRIVTGDFSYISPANDTAGDRSYVVELFDGDLSAVRVVNITVVVPPAPGTPPGTAPGTAPGAGGSSGGAGTSNP
ncbi:hypothetical protein C4580_02085 [Candidatus Woesearchaeota archaeon]|nr:MAG: hypothetical protein C4580_02085 [Candidatus Woesearchaeota archaeon]